MENQDRRNDWVQSVDDRLVSLTTAQKVTDDELDEIQIELARLDRIIRGDPEERLEGVLEDLHSLRTEVTRLTRLMDPDSLGHGGIIKNLESLMGEKTRSEKREGYHWTFITSVVLGLLSFLGLVVTNLDKIEAFWKRQQQPDPLEQMITKAKRPKRAKPRPRPVLRAIPPPPLPNDDETE